MDIHRRVSKLFDLKDRTIVVTGATGLLGAEFAHVLSDAGANVVLVGLWKVDKNKELESEIREKYHTRPSSYNIDISRQTDVKALVQSVEKKYGQIYGLINNAQFVPRKHPKRAAPFEGYPLELWNQTLDTNLTGVFLCCQEIGKAMSKQKRGVIVNVSSIYGMVGADQRIYGKSLLNSPASYAATKGAVINLTRYLASYFNRKNIRVNTLTLGGVFNDQDPAFVKRYSEKTMIGRMADKDEYNGALLFLMSDASSYMTGSNLVVDGGWTAW
jgi:NAD(P)-dependent dehydrogenase (short-subunit alcohol dehydrogenase family)